jgi:hypothetical protein
MIQKKELQCVSCSRIEFYISEDCTLCMGSSESLRSYTVCPVLYYHTTTTSWLLAGVAGLSAKCYKTCLIWVKYHSIKTIKVKLTYIIRGAENAVHVCTHSLYRSNRMEDITVYSPTTYTICCFQHTRFDRTSVIISVSMIMFLHYTSHHIRICALDTVIFIESTIILELW